MKSFCKSSEIGNTNNININIGNKHYFFTENMPIKQNLAFILSLSIINISVISSLFRQKFIIEIFWPWLERKKAKILPKSMYIVWQLKLNKEDSEFSLLEKKNQS